MRDSQVKVRHKRHSAYQVTEKSTYTVRDVSCFINLAQEVTDFGGDGQGAAHVSLAILLCGRQIGTNKLGLTPSVLRWGRKQEIQSYKL